MSTEGRAEILAAIEFYSGIGADWGGVVCYLSLKHTGRLERYMHPHRTRIGA